MAIGAGFMVLMLGLGWWIHVAGQDGFGRVEHTYLVDSVDRARQVLAQSAKGLEHSVQDYAVWDETYQFISKPNLKYESQNLNHDSLANLRITHALIFDEHLRPIAGRSVVPDQEESQPVPARVVKAAGRAVAWMFETRHSTFYGFLRNEDELYLIAGAQVYPTAKNLPPDGGMVFLRLVDSSLIKEFSQVLQQDLDLDLRGTSPEPFSLAGVTPELLRVRIPLHDYSGSPAGVAMLRLPRDIQRQAHRFTWMVWLALFTTLGLAGLLWPLTMRWFVLRRLGTIHAFVERLGRTKSLSERLPVAAGDELDALAAGFNRTLDALETEQILRDQAEEHNLSLQGHLFQVQKMETVATMAGGIAHDFNNCLAAIMGSLELIRDELPEEHPSRVHLERMWKAGTSASALAKQMLSFSRGVPVQRTEVHAGEAISEVLLLVRAGLPKSLELGFRNECADDRMLADVTQLQQVVMNLAANAAHAMADSPLGRIEVTLRSVLLPDEEQRPETLALPPGPYLRLDFADTGHGIPAEILDKVFDPFFTTKPAGSGTGLGLSMVHDFVTRYGGSIAVESTVHRGTRFIMHLPGAEGTSPNVVARPSRILLVDDDTHVRRAMAKGLRMCGHKVAEASNGDLALRIFEREGGAFDAVITDQIMPGMTGLELCEHLVARAPDLRLILISGFTATFDLESRTHLGLVACFMKPVAIRDLNAALTGSRNGS